MLRAQVVPSILIEPVPQRVVAGHTLQLLASAAPLSAEISWYRDGRLIPDVTGSTLTIENATAVNEGFYKALASLPGGECWSREVFVKIDTPHRTPGALDATFFTAAIADEDDSSVDAVLLLDDGRVAIGGEFQIGGGIRNLAVLLPDGSPDPDFALDGYPDGRVWALTQSGGRLIIGGQFGSVGGRAVSGIAAIDPATGELAPDWESPGFVSGRIMALATDAHGRVLAGGNFAQWRTDGGGAVDQPLLVRLGTGGARDSSFSTVLDANRQVRSIAVLASGRIAVGGSFTAPTTRFAVLEDSGALAAGFSLPEPPERLVRAVLPLPDGSFLLGGAFRVGGGDRLVHYWANGALDVGFSVSLDNDVNTLALDPDGKVLLGGAFRRVNQVPRRRLARLNADLSPDDSFRADGLNSEVNSIALSGQDLLVGGEFMTPHRLVLRTFADDLPSEAPLELVRSPLPRKTLAGSALDLAVAVTPVRSDQQFHWTRDGEFVALSSDPILNVDRATADQSGTYRVEIRDATGSTSSPPVRVDVTQALPGSEAEFRYRGEPQALPAQPTFDATLEVSDDFLIGNVRVSIDLLHPDTSNLEIQLICPEGVPVRLFRNGGRYGRDLRHTTFDDEAGDGAAIDDGQPPYTGTYKPDQDLAAMRSTSAAGTWRLRFSNGIPRAAELRDWKLELRAKPVPVNYENYLGALGLPASDTTRRAYVTAGLPDGARSVLSPVEVTPTHFVLSHWRWAAPLDATYTYERRSGGQWVETAPSSFFITRYPGGIEWRQVRLPTTAARAYFRLQADIE